MGQEFNLKAPIQDEDPYQVILDIGTVTFSTTDSQATYRTKLIQILGGAVNLTGTTSAATDAASNDEVSVPLGAVTSGSITLTRSSKGTSAGKYSVILLGTKYTGSP